MVVPDYLPCDAVLAPFLFCPTENPELVLFGEVPVKANSASAEELKAHEVSSEFQPREAGLRIVPPEAVRGCP